PLLPSSTLDGGVTLLDRPRTVENIGVYADLLSPTRAASTSVSRRTMASSGLFSTARRTASSSVRRNVPFDGCSTAGLLDCALAAAAINIAATTNTLVC